MADLILETGVGVPGANSYVDLTYADDYFAGHPYHADAWDALSADARESLLIASSLYVDLQYIWYGYRLTETQGLDWPRTLVYDYYGSLLPDGVPDRLRRAVAEQAFHMSRGDVTAPSASAGITDLKIDVIELSFDKAVRPVLVPSPVLLLLRGLGEYRNGARYRKVLVG